MLASRSIPPAAKGIYVNQYMSQRANKVATCTLYNKTGSGLASATS
jgi:hypothetical protein